MSKSLFEWLCLKTIFVVKCTQLSVINALIVWEVILMLKFLWEYSMACVMRTCDFRLCDHCIFSRLLKVLALIIWRWLSTFQIRMREELLRPVKDRLAFSLCYCSLLSRRWVLIVRGLLINLMRHISLMVIHYRKITMLVVILVRCKVCEAMIIFSYSCRNLMRNHYSWLIK